jgi:2'-5' RNA ligase
VILRTFIAIDLPVDLLQNLAATQTALQADLRARGMDRALRWSPTKNLHLTLRFLGDTTAPQREALMARLQPLTAATSPFTLQVDTGGRGLGGFPNLGQPRVLWTGVTGDLAALQHLQGAIEQMVQAIGLAPEAKSFAPHLTLARAAREADRRALAQVGQATGDFARTAPATTTSFAVEHVTLYQSELAAGGSRYTPLAVLPFAAT